MILISVLVCILIALGYSACCFLLCLHVLYFVFVFLKEGGCNILTEYGLRYDWLAKSHGAGSTLCVLLPSCMLFSVVHTVFNKKATSSASIPSY